MSDAADRRIADLEALAGQLRAHIRAIENHNTNQYKTIKEIEKKLVERDVYEAQQILPPEQAALIKHLATVERCIEDGRQEISGYDIEVRCVFCQRDEAEPHDKTCAWLALQFDRKPEATMAMVRGWAMEEHIRREQTRARAVAAPKRPLHTMIGLAEWLANDPENDRRANEVVERSRAETLGNVRVYENPLVAPGRVYLMQPAAYMNPLEVTRVDMPVAPNLGIGGDESEVAPSESEEDNEKP
jgi:hypothetical protein